MSAMQRRAGGRGLARGPASAVCRLSAPVSTGGRWARRAQRQPAPGGSGAAFAAGIGRFSVPPGLVPLGGESIPLAGLRTIRYGKWSDRVVPGQPTRLDVDLVVMQLPQHWASDRQSLVNLLRNQRRREPAG